MREEDYQLLLVTENDIAAEHIEKLLAAAARASFDVRRVNSLSAAMKAVGTRSLDAILMGGSLGDVSLSRACIRLLEIDCDLPIVALLEAGDDDDDAELLATGVQDVLRRSDCDGNSLGRALRYAIERARALRELLESESLLHSILRNLSEGVIVADQAERLLLVNPAARQLLGLGSVAGLQTDVFGMYEPDTVTRIPDGERLMARALRGETITDREIFHRNADAPGGRFLSVNARPLKNASGAVSGGIVSFRDMTARKKVEDELAHLSLYDDLTGVPNRAFFIETLRKALARASRAQSRLAVLLLDLDRFKQLNDRLGREAGDQLLGEIARRLTNGLRSGDFLARLGGDEFVVMFENFGHNEHAAGLADKIREVMEPAFRVGKQRISVSASIGISTFPECGDDAGSLLKTAEVAMFRAKESGRNTYHFYSRSVHAEMSRRSQLELDLRTAIRDQQFELEYQPVADLHTGEVQSLEVLLRWNHPDHGMIRPLEFLPILETTGTLNRVGEWTLANACLQIRDWQRVLDRPALGLSINMAALQLGHHRIIDIVERILTNAALAPECLTIEINEATLLAEPRAIRENLSVLVDDGVTLALDNFGTGHASLQAIRLLPLSYIKLDRSLVMSLPTDPEDVAFVNATLRLAGDLGLRVIAEGIEVDEQARFLTEHGCRLGQGHLISPPLPVTSVNGFLGRDWRAA
jgi:two-component system CheB/CheR fusion protein